MKRNFVASSNISYVNYDGDENILEVEFKNGAVYSYDAVPEHVFEFFLESPSKGKFFHQHIRNKYPATCIRK